MQLRRSKALVWAAIALLSVAAVYVAVLRFRPHVEDRVYVIGWQRVPPFQEKGPDGSPAGLAIDLVREAARRRGIRLKWVWYPESAEKALRNRDLDLWPLITITPERKQQGAIYISKPYLQHDHSLLVLAGSSYSQVQDLASASISYPGQPISKQLIERVLPHARTVTAGSDKDAVEHVCTGETDAAFLDEFTAAAVMLTGISCSSRPLRQIGMPMLRSELGVGSTLQARAVADEIRRGIEESTAEGDLTKTLANAGYFSRRNLEYFSALLQAQRRERWLIFTAGTFGCLLAFTLFAGNQIRRQRNRIKATDKTLRESEQKLRLMANNLTEMVLAYDMDRQLLFANPAVEQLTGYSASELQRDGSMGWVHPDDRQRVLEHWEKLFQGVAYRDEEYRLLTKDGRVRWAIASWGPIFDDAGHQVGVAGSERDITERKTAERAVLETERKFRELLEGVQLVAVMTDLLGTITFCNDYGLRITGWSREEVVGRPAKGFLTPESPLRATEHMFFAMLAGGTQPMCEAAVLAKDGARRLIRWSSTLLRNSAGRVEAFASLGEDVTELYALRAEAAQRESDERFRNIADTAPLMIWVTAADGACTFVNHGWLTFTGLTLEQALGLGWTSTVHPQDLEKCLASCNAAKDARRTFHMEYRQRRADGEYRWVMVSGAPRFGLDGEFAGFVGNCSDITDLKRSRDEDAELQKLESVGRLAGGIAHDFNNLFGGVLALVDMAGDELAEGVVPSEQLNNIRALVTRGAGILRQLMIYAGDESTGSETINLSCVVGEMHELLNIVVSKHSVLQTQLANDLPAVRADSAQLQHVVMNLVTNASEALGEREGAIVIRTALAASRPSASRADAPHFVALEVSDTGCGIAPEAQRQIFNPFYTTKAAGHGLGLCIVQRIVHDLGGAVELESDLGRGSTFRVLLPTCCEMLPAAGERNGTAGSGERNHNPLVLIVEDESVLRSALSKQLRKNGYRVLEAADGTEALRTVREHKDNIAVVLLDITLPGAPSRDVLAETRRVGPHTKVVVTSAYGQNAVDAAFPGMKVDLFVRKPYRLGDVVDTVRTILSTSNGKVPVS